MTWPDWPWPSYFTTDLYATVHRFVWVDIAFETIIPSGTFWLVFVLPANFMEITPVYATSPKASKSEAVWWLLRQDIYRLDGLSVIQHSNKHCQSSPQKLFVGVPMEDPAWNNLWKYRPVAQNPNVLAFGTMDSSELGLTGSYQGSGNTGLWITWSQGRRLLSPCRGYALYSVSFCLLSEKRNNHFSWLADGGGVEQRVLWRDRRTCDHWLSISVRIRRRPHRGEPKKTLDHLLFLQLNDNRVSKRPALSTDQRVINSWTMQHCLLRGYTAAYCY